MSSSANPAPPTAATPQAPIFSIKDLAASVNAWCAENGIAPANGQAATELNERNIRYYRVRGLLDAPGSGVPHAGAARRGFTEKHAAQLRVIRVLQARGLPLGRIQQEITGRSTEDLRALERRELGKPPEPPAPALARRSSELGPKARHRDATSRAGDAAPGAGSQIDAAVLDPEEGEEGWLVNAVGDDFLLVSRRGRRVSAEQRRLLAAVLRA